MFVYTFQRRFDVWIALVLVSPVEKLALLLNPIIFWAPKKPPAHNTKWDACGQRVLHLYRSQQQDDKG